MRSALASLIAPTPRYASPRDHAARKYRAAEAADARLGARARQLRHRPDQRVEAVGRAAGGEPVGAEIAHLVLQRRETAASKKPGPDLIRAGDRFCVRPRSFLNRIDVLDLPLRIHRGDRLG